MGAAQLMRLPTATDNKVVQTRRAGRLPNSVARLHVARYERYKKEEQRRAIEEQVERLEGVIATSERLINNAKYEMHQLRNVQPGTPVAVKVREYLEWINLPWQEKQRWESLGYQPKEWPL